MSSDLAEVVRHVQNPALGAVLQWRFVVGHQEVRRNGAGAPLLLLFLVLPIVFHQETYSHLESTRRASGLRKFAAKFSITRSNQSDLLLDLHRRVDAMRRVSLESLQIASTNRLLWLDIETGSVHALSSAQPQRGVPKRIDAFGRNAEKFGQWCAELSLFDVASVLKVRF